MYLSKWLIILASYAVYAWWASTKVGMLSRPNPREIKSSKVEPSPVITSIAFAPLAGPASLIHRSVRSDHKPCRPARLILPITSRPWRHSAAVCRLRDCTMVLYMHASALTIDSTAWSQEIDRLLYPIKLLLFSLWKQKGLKLPYYIHYWKNVNSSAAVSTGHGIGRY